MYRGEWACTWDVVDSTVDDHGASLQPFPSDQLCSPRPYNQDVCSADLHTGSTLLIRGSAKGACEGERVTCSGRSGVFEWQVVTVAWFHSSRSRIGAPTILLRPITTACFPARDTPTDQEAADLNESPWQ